MLVPMEMQVREQLSPDLKFAAACSVNITRTREQHAHGIKPTQNPKREELPEQERKQINALPQTDGAIVTTGGNWSPVGRPDSCPNACSMSLQNGSSLPLCALHLNNPESRDVAIKCPSATRGWHRPNLPESQLGEYACFCR